MKQSKANHQGANCCPATNCTDVANQFDDLPLQINERVQLAHNPSTPADVLKQLAKDEEGWVRWEVAGNPRTPVDVLAQLAADKNWGVRQCVAQNPSTSIGVLKQLAADQNWGVRQCVAQNPHAPGDVLTQLAADEDGYVRWHVARNPSLPLDSETFKDLMIDSEGDVRTTTMERLHQNLEGLTK